MTNDNENKIDDTKPKIGKFNVGDVVRLKSAHNLIELKSIKEDKPSVYNPVNFINPYMVVSEIFEDEKIGKTLFSTEKGTTKPKQIKDVGEHPIRVKCIWFYEGKSHEKVFWQDVLEKV